MDENEVILKVKLRPGDDIGDEEIEALKQFVFAHADVRTVDVVKPEDLPDRTELLEDLGARLFQIENWKDPTCPLREMRGLIEGAVGSRFDHAPKMNRYPMPWFDEQPEEADGCVPDVGVWMKPGGDKDEVAGVVGRMKGVLRAEPVLA